MRQKSNEFAIRQTRAGCSAGISFTVNRSSLQKDSIKGLAAEVGMFKV